MKFLFPRRRGFTPYHFLKKSGKGFTLVELIVSMGVFALIITLATGAYFIVLGVNREARATSAAIDNLSFALDTMTRSIRTGTNYASPSQGTDFSFTDSNGVPNVRYYLNGTAIVKNTNDSPITDSTIQITSLKFDLVGQTKGDPYQPHVTMIVSGTVTTGPGSSVPFTIQTSATMRGTDL